MPKFKVMSGEFQIVIKEKTLRKAADSAIKIHNESNSSTSLGELTLVEKLNSKDSTQTGDHVFLSTQSLIDDNTLGLGEDKDQYSRIK